MMPHWYVRAKTFYRTVLAITGGLCLIATGRAQTPTDPPAIPASTADTPASPPPTTTPESKISLKDVLAKAHLGNVGLALAVGAEKNTLSKKEWESKGIRTVRPAAEAFGLINHIFGSITAIGPATYIELNTDFTGANPFADMPPNQAFTLLLAGLDDHQRNALASKAGLGLSDLTTPEQKNLFEVLIPDKELVTIPATNVGNLREKAASIRFRVEETLTYGQMNADNTGYIDISPPDTADKVPTYQMDSNSYYYNSKVNGVVIRHEIPNRLKPSHVDYTSPRLQVAIPIKNLNTVGDLIARVAKQTGLEIYADVNYEKMELTWVTNGADAALAGEMLRAVAFCLPATYRRVGSAFVLTESLDGAGTRRQKIQDFEEECNAKRKKAIQDAEKSLKENPSQKNLKLQSFDNPLAMTAEQEKQPTNLDADDTFYIVTSLSFDQMTQKQKDAIQSNATKKNYSFDVNAKFNIYRTPKVQMLISDLSGTVDFYDTFFGGDLFALFHPDLVPAHPTEDEWKKFLKAYQNLPKWTEAAKAYACRAVICRPHTTKEVDDTLTRISGRGFNQMWLVVFENGKSEIPGTPFPLDKAVEGQPDLLTYAIAAGAKKGIKICPVVNLYAWGSDAPAELRLRTLRGEDSAQNAMRRYKVNTAYEHKEVGFDSESDPKALEAYVLLPPSPAVFVNPLNRAVQTKLAEFFKVLSAHTGMGNWVCRSWRKYIFFPYSVIGYSIHDKMGYNVDFRESFLQKYHRDPIDIDNEPIYTVDTSLTNYVVSSSDLRNKWSTFCKAGLYMALHSLFNAALQNSGEKKLNIIFEKENRDNLERQFDVWNDPDSPLPDADMYDPKQSSVYFLSKEPAGIRPLLPKELQGVDWHSLQMRTLEMLKPYRKWEGVVIEE